MSEPPSLIVGIGASAGGLAAFKSFLRHTPSDTGMAFVLVQHLDSHHKSLLVELPGAQSPIPVVAAEDGVAVKPNCVFVIPPDATLTIEGGVLRLVTPAPAREHRRPIDTFLTSLAEDCGERAVGIVLAGVGSDGTIGIRTIKELGGLTLAQAERDATAMRGMPSSAAAAGLVDHVVPVEVMPARLIDYHKHINRGCREEGRATVIARMCRSTSQASHRSCIGAANTISAATRTRPCSAASSVACRCCTSITPSITSKGSRPTRARSRRYFASS
jgi:two-component system, chemotaxis family, CheB/CheR fusion protein